jgi:hypothetical protein
VLSLREGLIPSDGSHLGSISAESIDPESIGDSPEDEFVDHIQQEGGGGRSNLAAKLILLGPEFGIEECIVGNDDIDEDGGGALSPKADPSPTTYSTTSKLFFCLLTLRWQERLLVLSRYLLRLFVSRSILPRQRLVLTMPMTLCTCRRDIQQVRKP